MKKCLKQIPRYKLGVDGTMNLISGGTLLATSMMEGAQTSAQQGTSAGNTAKSALSGALAGASMGAMLGPWGAAAGAVIGGAASAITAQIGRKGSVDPITGEIEYGSGWKGKRGPSDNELRSRSRDIVQQNANREYNQTAAYDYYQEHGANGYTLAADGGIIPNALAFVDDGELLRTPDGQMIEIPEQGKPTDSNLVSVPEGTQVLSDSLKVPGTKQTFAEVGKKIMKKKKYGNDKYALTSKMLNDRNNQQAYDELLALQESMKKNKRAKKISKYEEGTNRIRNVESSADYATDIYGTDPYWQAWNTVNRNNYTEANNMQRNYYDLGLYDSGDMLTYNQDVQDYLNAFNQRFNPINRQIGNLRSEGTIVGRGGTSDTPTEWAGDGYAGYQTQLRTLGRNATDNQLMSINARLNPRGLEAYNDPETGMVYTRPFSTTLERDDLSALAAPIDTSIPSDPLGTRSSDTEGLTRSADPESADTGGSTNWLGYLNALAPAVSTLSSFTANWLNSRDTTPEQVPPRYARAYFSPVEYRINPQLNAINRSNATTRYNMSQLAPRTGANLAYGIQAAVARNRAINEAYNNQRVINNQTRANNASLATQTSQYNANAQHTADVENAQNRAKARSLRRYYRSANAQIIPQMLKDYRSINTDAAVLNYMQPFLTYGTTEDSYTKLKNLVG